MANGTSFKMFKNLNYLRTQKGDMTTQMQGLMESKKSLQEQIRDSINRNTELFIQSVKNMKI